MPVKGKCFSDFLRFYKRKLVQSVKLKKRAEIDKIAYIKNDEDS